MSACKLHGALNRAQRRGQVVRDSGDKAVKLLSRDTLSVSSAYRFFFGSTKSIDEPADDDRDAEKQTEIDGVTYACDGGPANRFSQQNVVSHPAGERRDDRRAAAGSHRETDHQHNHQVLKDEGRQRQLSADSGRAMPTAYAHASHPDSLDRIDLMLTV
jgi:hypothetical protein